MAESPQAEPRGLHIVLFGMAASGKSSLLGALAQAAQGQQQVLGGKLDDVPDGMQELRKRLYGRDPARGHMLDLSMGESYVVVQ